MRAPSKPAPALLPGDPAQNPPYSPSALWSSEPQTDSRHRGRGLQSPRHPNAGAVHAMGAGAAGDRELPRHTAGTVRNPEDVFTATFALAETTTGTWPRRPWSHGLGAPPALPGEQMARGCEVPGSWRSAHLFPLGDANCHPPGQPPRICMQAHTQDSGWPAPSNAAGLLTSQRGPGHRGASGDLPAWASPASPGLTARGDVGGLRGLASVPSVSIPPWPCVHPPRERTGDRPVRIARLPSLDWPPGLPEGPPPPTPSEKARCLRHCCGAQGRV